MMKKFDTSIQVDKRIVPLLSRSTYHRNFPYAVRELVSNAYDADALTVKIKISRNLKTVIVEDDGNGMSEADFKRYLTIARKKSEKPRSLKYKRKRIGFFGIGFLSILPFCEELVITTTAENSEEIIEATIPSINFFEMGEDDFVQNIPVTGKIFNNPKERLKHYTKIELVSPTFYLKNHFKEISIKKRNTIDAWDPYDKFKWELQEDLPIGYKQKNKINNFISYYEPIGLSVYFNDEKLYRNELPKNLLDSGEYSIGELNVRYIFCTDYRSVKPTEARGIKRRVNNVGIGNRTDFNLKRSRGFSRLHWITGEVHISEEIKEHLNLSRDDFVSNPLIIEIEEFLADKLRKQANIVEKIAEAERDLQNITKSERKSTVQSKGAIIDYNIGKLIRAGFEVVTADKSDKEISKDVPIKVDKKRKMIIVGDLVKFKKDSIVIFNKKYKIIYTKWDYNSNFPACRFSDDNIIEVNRSYPFFESKTYGNIVKKIHIVLLVARKDSRTKAEMYEKIVSNFENEFKEYL